MAWNQISTIADNEFRQIIREKTFLMLLFVFLLMALFTAYIGWSTTTIVIQVYTAAVAYLQQAGTTTIPHNPLSTVPTLAIFQNMIIYIVLIGALLGIILGHRSFIRERKSGVIQLLFTKPMSPQQYLIGKILGIMISLSLLLLLTFIISLLSSLFIPQHTLTFTEVIKLFLFYCFSFVYLLLFSLIGLCSAILFSTESLALFSPVLVWVAITFITPELITGQNPVALLNPTNLDQSAPQGTFFSMLHSYLYPLSVEQHFVGITTTLLEAHKNMIAFTPVEILISTSKLIFSLFFYVFIAIASCVFALRKYKVTNDKLYE